MGRREIEETIEQLGKALSRLEEVLQRSPLEDSIVLDASIQRFEFTVELCWKALKKMLAAEGIEATTPRNVLQQCYAIGWISDEQIWLRMLQDRNLTSHTYREEQAKAIYNQLPEYTRIVRGVYEFLQNKLS